MKRKIWRKLINTAAFAMATVMLVNTTGCAESGKFQIKSQSSTEEGNGESAKGRYIETEVKMPERCGSPKVNTFDDGSVAFIDIKNGILCSKKSIEENDWERKEISKLQELIEQNQDIQVAVPSKEGKVFVAYNNWEEADESDDYPVHYLLIDTDGTTKELSFADISKMEHAVFADEETLYVGDYNGSVMRYNISTGSCEKIMDTETQYIAEFQIFKDKLFVVDDEKAYSYDLSTNTMDEEDSVLNEFIAKSTSDGEQAYCMDAENPESIYLMSRNGIYHHKIGGSVMEKLVDGLMTNLSDLSVSPTSICEKNGIIYIFFDDGKAYSYQYDEMASAEMENQIEVYALEDSKTVRQAISAFRKSNPDTFVKFEIGVDSDSGIQKSDAITAINTKLLAGEGPDVMILDGLPMEKYQEKGILDDMSDIVDAVSGKESYFEGILRAYEKDGKICAIPAKAKIPMVIGDKDMTNLVNGTESLADVSEKILSEKQIYATAVGLYTPEEALKLAYFGSSNSWKTADGKVKEEKIKEILETAKTIYEDDQKNLTEDQKKEHENLEKEMETYGITTEQLWGNVGKQMRNVVGKYQYIGIGNLESMSDVSEVFSVPHEHTNVGYCKYNGDDENMFVPENVIGICSSSDDKELASAFVKEMLGKDVQKIDIEEGFPISKDAYQDFTVDPDPDGIIGMGFTGADGQDVDLTIDWPSDTELTQLENWLDTASVPQNLDEDVKEILIENGKAAVSGEKDVDSCAKEIVQKLSLYLAE